MNMRKTVAMQYNDPSREQYYTDDVDVAPQNVHLLEGMVMDLYLLAWERLYYS